MATVTLCQPQTEQEAGLVQGLLEDAGIPCVLRRLSMWELGGATRQYYGVWGEVWVDESQLAEARETISVMSQGTDGQPDSVADDVSWLRKVALRQLRWRQAFWGAMALSGWITLFFGFAMEGSPDPSAYWLSLLLITAPSIYMLARIARMQPGDGFLT